MKITHTALWTLLFLFALVLSACDQLASVAGPLPGTDATAEATAPLEPTEPPIEPTATGEPLIAAADIESLEVVTEEQPPGQVSVRLRGILPNECTVINEIIIEQEGDSHNLTVLTIEEQGQDCSDDAVPFEETVVLDVSDLAPGSYNVVANERQVSFELAAEEAQETVETATVEETATAPPLTASLSGLVWHDSCANIAVDGAELPAGCILTADDLFLADGQLQDEEGIAGVELALGEGACPATVVNSLLTDEQGAFNFNDLAAGTYCLFVDMTRTQNQGILGVGSWAAPEDDSPQFTVTLEPGDSQDGFNFGWDYLNLPAAAAADDLADCTNSFEFVTDLSIPDDTAFPPGESFTKEWQLRNNGTCPWTAGYSIVFVGGDLMSADESMALEQVTAPGEDLEVAIDMIAPEEPGTYRGNWQVADAGGEPFGIDGVIEDAFWLQIVVAEDVEPNATPLPNSAAVGGVVWDDFCLNSEPGQGCLEFPQDSGIFVGDGTFGPAESPLSDILIGLADGVCATDGTFPDDSALVETTVTEGDGRYQFEGLSEGTYCLFMDALDPEMVELLIPGNWTWPGTGVGQYTIVLDPGEQILDLDFGWDYID